MFTFRVSIAVAAAVLLLAFSATPADDPLAFMIGFTGTVKVAGQVPQLGMAIYSSEEVSVARSSSASILLKDDNLYKIGASSNVKVKPDLISGDIKKLPKKDGTWAILYKKFQDRVKAQSDISQYGAVRSDGFKPDLTFLSKGDVKKLVAAKRTELGLQDDTVEYYLIGGSVWEYHSYYQEAYDVYQKGLNLSPFSKELTLARAIVKAKMN
jgi:hypothetical protein